MIIAREGGEIQDIKYFSNSINHLQISSGRALQMQLQSAVLLPSQYFNGQDTELILDIVTVMYFGWVGSANGFFIES